MKVILTMSLLLLNLICFSQSENQFYIGGNLLGNGANYSINAEYVPNLNMKVKPGILVGGGFNNVYEDDADGTIPARLNLHFGYRRKHHFIIGGGLGYKINKDEASSEGYKPVDTGFGGFNYHLDIGKAVFMRAGIDVTYFGDSHSGIIFPVPNLSFGARF